MMNQTKVLVTGASRGIGRAIALRLQDDYDLILHSTSEATLQPLWQQLKHPDRHVKLCADFSDRAAVGRFCNELKQRYSGMLLCVINNAAIMEIQSILFQPEARIDKELQVNLKAPIIISKVAFKIFHAHRHGIIINISSCIGELGNAFQCVYAATKAGLTSFTKSLAREAGALMKDHSVRVCSIAPGYIETDMTADMLPGKRITSIDNIPAGRFGTADEVANVVAFLMTNAAGYINGSEIKINGGII